MGFLHSLVALRGNQEATNTTPRRKEKRPCVFLGGGSFKYSVGLVLTNPGKGQDLVCWDLEFRPI